MLSRRALLQLAATTPVLGHLATYLGWTTAAPALLARDYFKELGLRPFINAAGTFTMLTASQMPGEVTDAIRYASTRYVRLDDIQDAVGARIASLLRCEAATVTAGAASALTLGTAGVLTGLDEKRAAQLPDVTGMKSEVILQRAHYVGYVHAIRNCGVTMVYVDTAAELEAAISNRTALLLFINALNEEGEVKDAEFVAIGKKHGVPTFNDCAADVPPVENLWKYTEMGFDIVAFSGGKGIRGPQSAGLLLGRKDLIAAARLSAPPRGDTIGRGMKINKEEILAMLVALEIYLEKDHDKERRLWERQVGLIADRARSVAGVETEIHVPPIANHVPSLRVWWDADRVRITPPAVREALRAGDPSIEMMGNDDRLDITTWMMRPGEEKIVARRLEAVLRAAAT